jgi:Cu+-exporting ATPase
MAEELIKDPVCGMRIQPVQVVAVSEHAGSTYRFCSEACKQKFDRDPARFVPPRPAA